jgi:hypothetical protein
VRTRLLTTAALLVAMLLPSVANAAGQYYQSDREVRREIREGRREIARERREMRREVRREIRERW